jgi:hypothetical protein
MSNAENTAPTTFEGAVDMVAEAMGKFKDVNARENVLGLLANARGLSADAAAADIFGRFQGGEFDRYLKNPVAARIGGQVNAQKNAARSAAQRIGGNTGDNW